MTIETPFYKYTGRMAVGLAAAGGLMSAAFISGLPNVTCRQLARVYGYDLQIFGLAGLCGVMAVGVIAYVEAGFKKPNQTDTVMICVLVGAGIVAILVGALMGVGGLSDAFDQCWPITEPK